MNPLPPQAYTKDVFLNAYSWLQNQPKSIREIATTPDVLVSLYLKASRDGASSLERPSIQNFKNELKNLAGMMGELEKPFENENHTFQSATNANSSAAVNSNTSVSSTVVPNSSQMSSQLDPQTQQILAEIKELYNLSHENEALRMLVKIGYSKARDFLK